jgi:hypothetical protein
MTVQDCHTSCEVRNDVIVGGAVYVRMAKS